MSARNGRGEIQRCFGWGNVAIPIPCRPSAKRIDTQAALSQTSRALRIRVRAPAFLVTAIIAGCAATDLGGSQVHRLQRLSLLAERADELQPSTRRTETRLAVATSYLSPTTLLARRPSASGVLVIPRGRRRGVAECRIHAGPSRFSRFSPRQRPCKTGRTMLRRSLRWHFSCGRRRCEGEVVAVSTWGPSFFGPARQP